MKKRDQRFEEAIEAFDAIHREDPEEAFTQDGKVTRSLRYHQRLTHWVEQLSGEPSEALRLAARCQHLRRRAIPRGTFPPDKVGYRKWRTALAEFHAREAASILHRVGYSETLISRVIELLLKRRLGLDREVQLFEDSICLVFLEYELPEFAKKHDEMKLRSVLQKTWKKMSALGHEGARALSADLEPEVQALLLRSIESDD